MLKFKQHPSVRNQMCFTKYKSNTGEADWRKMKKIILQGNTWIQKLSEYLEYKERDEERAGKQSQYWLWI